MTMSHSHYQPTRPSTPMIGAIAGLPAKSVRACLRAAVAAPSVHNSQPWRFRLYDGGIDVLADRGRGLDVIDPLGRELLISVGAAVLNLRVAMLNEHRLPILRLLADPDEPDLVARLVPGDATEPDATARALGAVIPRRHTNRQPFRPVPVPGEVIDELAAAAAAEGAVLALADPAGRDAIRGLARTADEWQRAESGYRAELTTWTLPILDRRDGVPPTAFGPRDERDDRILRDFGLTQPELRRRSARFEAHPTLVVLSTAADQRADWIRAGQALERVLLTATVRGVASTPMTQAVEVPELRQLISDPPGGRYAQVILRLGYAPPAAPSPRRPLVECVVTGSAW